MQEQEGSAMGPVNINFSQSLSSFGISDQALLTASDTGGRVLSCGPGMNGIK